MNIPLAAEPLFHIGSFTVTNALVNSTLAAILFVGFALLFRTKITHIPGRLQGSVETLFETLLGYFDSVTGDREKSRRFFPLVATLFLFILVSNWMGLLPWTGTVGLWEMKEGVRELVPLFRPAGSDLNLTVALALFSVVASHLLGMFTIGFFRYVNKYIQLGTLTKAIVSLKPIAILTAVIEFGVGFIEIFSEVAKVVSLSLRLFGNIFAGEVLITVLSSLVAYGVPIPFMGLELLVGVIQATVFTLLVLVYLTVATTEPHGDHDGDHETTHHASHSAHAEAS